MISSMTGFAKLSETTDVGVLDWEIRAVNHRYLEIFTRLPEAFRSLEIPIRTLIQKHIKRGKMDVVLQFTPHAEQASFEIDQAVLRQLQAAIVTVQTVLPDASVNALEVLRWHQVMKSSGKTADNASDLLLSSLEKALQEFIVVRQREGQSLCEAMLAMCDQLQSHAAKITTRLSLVMAYERQRIVDKFAEFALTADPIRLEQEIVWVLQKADIAEELARLTVHLEEVRRVLKQDAVVGRRLDFLMQELNREVNTIASKSLDVETTQSTVDMKVLIEQLREQVQNLE